MIEENSMDPHFKIMPKRASLKNATYTKEYEEPTIMEVLMEMENMTVIDYLKHLHMNKELQEKLKLKTETLTNNTINSKNRIKDLNTNITTSFWHSIGNTGWPILLLLIATTLNCLYLRRKRSRTDTSQSSSSPSFELKSLVQPIVKEQ